MHQGIEFRSTEYRRGDCILKDNQYYTNRTTIILLAKKFTLLGASVGFHFHIFSLKTNLMY